MKGKFLLTASLVSLSLYSAAQNARTYAITGKSNNNFLWADIKQIDMATGKVVKTLFESDKTPFKVNALDKSVDKVQVPNPTGFGVAACAIDERHGRLYFAPMHFSDIRYLDLNKEEASFTVVKKNIIPLTPGNVYQQEENHITRMVIAADGYGYALTNDANHLIRFTTGKKPVVEDLGALVDAEENKGFSVHNKCTSWGGDMLADAYGKLYLISANQQVFKIDVDTRIATHLGAITGLPAGYSTNAAAVNANGDIVICSATKFDGYYSFKLANLAATKIQGSDLVYNASDLAGSNLLLQQEYDAAGKFSMADSKLAQLNPAGESKVFPNPVTESYFSVLFDGKKEGVYTILLTDLAGRTIQTKMVNISKGKQIENINLSARPAKGMYMVKILDANKQAVHTEKVMIQ